MDNWTQHPLYAGETSDLIITPDGGRIKREVPPDNVSGDALIGAGSVVAGADAIVSAGAEIIGSYIENVRIGEAAKVTRSLVRTGTPRVHKCDPAGRFVIAANGAGIGADVQISNSTLINTTVADRTVIDTCAVSNAIIGHDNLLINARFDLVRTGRDVLVKGPTELSEAWVGDKATFDKRGYFEGVFLDEMPVLAFDESTGRVVLTDTIKLPHVSRYGVNAIHSSNNGKMKPQRDGTLTAISRHADLWHDDLLSHEPMYFGPMCWIADWTKVIGQSSAAHETFEDQINDPYFTYCMSFSVSGLDGEMTRGRTPPGEKSTGIGYKRRVIGWVFDNAPGAVIAMVGRLYDALEPERRSIADSVVVTALNNSRALLLARAHASGCDLTLPESAQRGSQKKRMARAMKRLSAHLEPGVWEFQNGNPTHWVLVEDGHWKNDLLDADGDPDIPGSLTETHLLVKDDTPAVPVSPVFTDSEWPFSEMGSDAEQSGDVSPNAYVDPSAEVGADVIVKSGAWIGPGCSITGKSTVGSDTMVFLSHVDNALIGSGSEILLSRVSGAPDKRTMIGSDSRVSYSRIADSVVGKRTVMTHARVENGTISDRAELLPFTRIADVMTTRPIIIGGTFNNASVTTTLMSMHMAGYASGVIAAPSTVIDSGGRHVQIDAIPMIGGGAVLKGGDSAVSPIILEGAFIGSNSIINGPAYIGLGAFVLGGMSSGEGVLPFTMKIGPGPKWDDIGGVLPGMGNVIVTHFINWTFQSLPVDMRRQVVHLVEGGARLGMLAIKEEIKRRQRGNPFHVNGPWGKFSSLPEYSPEQLERGLDNYNEALDGRWKMAVSPDGELSLTPVNGEWRVFDGALRFMKKSS